MNECYKIALINFSEEKSIMKGDEHIATDAAENKAKVAEKRLQREYVAFPEYRKILTDY